MMSDSKPREGRMLNALIFRGYEYSGRIAHITMLIMRR
jgi:hypothetical protein